MTEPLFFKPAHTLSLRVIADLTGAELPAGAREIEISNVAPLDRAGPHDLTFCDSAKYRDQLTATRAGACLIAAELAAHAPAGLPLLLTRAPYRAFVSVIGSLFPGALRPSSLFDADGIASGAHVHVSARLENGVVIDPGAVIGPGAEVGMGSVIGAGAVIGPKVRIGRDCSIGPGTSIQHSLIGDRVIIHGGCRIGQDGFGFVMAGGRHVKVPQVGRVIIQDDVEIGAGTTIDRGGVRDTTIGEGTKIDNLVQVGHNAAIGRHCILVAQTGISGSATVEDFAVLGARVGVNNHVTIGEAAQIAATSIVFEDVPPRGRWAGAPAKPARQYWREMAILKRLARRSRDGETSEPTGRGEGE